MSNLGIDIGLGAVALLSLVGIGTIIMNRKTEVREPELPRPNERSSENSDNYNTPTDSRNNAFRTSTEQRDFEDLEASRLSAYEASQERNDAIHRRLFGTPRKGGKRKSTRKSKRKSKRKL